MTYRFDERLCIWWAGDVCGLTASGPTKAIAESRLRDLMARGSSGRS